jgi:tripartite ATP-independent transporter DctM subunit
LTTTAATTGLIIPPSNIMIVYSLVSGGVSIAAMFVGGILPGLIFGLFLMFASGIISRKRGYGSGKRATFREVLITFKRAILSMLLVVVILGGILSGIFTATEAAAVAVVYAFLLSVMVYREVRLRELPDILLQCGITTGVVFLLIGTSSALSWIMAYESIPQHVSASLLSISDNVVVVMIIINLVLLFVGVFMDMTPAVLIFTPIFLPVAQQFGIHPVHFGVILISNLCIGLCTPPVGTCLFVGCGVGKTTLAKVTKSLIPFLLAMIAALLVITFLSSLSLFLPRALNLI